VIRTVAQIQPSALPSDARGQTKRTWLRETLNRVALLVPQAAAQGPHDPLVYALAFVERYHHDVPQLELEWQFLSFALVRAWQCANYAAVVRLVDDLAYIVGRVRDHAAAEEVLRIGIAASRFTRDTHHVTLFLSRLGGLIFSHGQREAGRRLWRAGQRLARLAGTSSGIWEPLVSFAQISDMLGGDDAVRTFAEDILRGRGLAEPDTLAVALFLRGFHARVHDRLEEAHDSFVQALRLLALRPCEPESAPARQVLMLTLQAELARVRGEFPRALAYAETTFSLSRIYSDHYTIAALLLDQGIFSYYLGHLADCQTTIAHLRAAAPQLEDLPIYQYGFRYLERHVPSSTALATTTIARRAQTISLVPLVMPEPLSVRELEVLRLVADGLANREIAARLVITPSTVKKHLEHIYGKLGTQSRTAAVARARALHLLS
jgi:DNA-binding NarL/FixJ family response regulator